MSATFEKAQNFKGTTMRRAKDRRSHQSGLELLFESPCISVTTKRRSLKVVLLVFGLNFLKKSPLKCVINSE